MKFRAEHSVSRADKLKTSIAIGLSAIALSACGHSVEAKESPESGATVVAVEPVFPTRYEVPKPDVVEQLQSAWETAMIGAPGEVDIAVYDIASGKTAHWNTPGATTFNTASIIKYSILAETLLQHQADGQPLDGYDLSEAEAMIENSDNGAASYLWRQVGGAPAMQHFFNAMAGTESTTTGGSWGLTQTTALDQIQVLKLLSFPGSPLTPESIATMNELFADVVPYQHWGVSGGIPEGVPVWLKNGWLNDSSTNDKYSDTTSWTVNSIGNVDNKYLIAVLSDGNPVGASRAEQNGIDRIETLSKITWDIMSAEK